MSLRLAKPLLQDYVYVAARMRDDERAQFCAMTGCAEYDAELCARAGAAATGPAWVYVDDAGLPVLLGGFEPQRNGVYEGWHMATQDAWAKHWRAFTKISVRLMDDLFANGAHRIQTCALISRTQAHRWYERALGMACEGVQYGYFADGQDGVMFARVRA